jgi:hypothetical protein
MRSGMMDFLAIEKEAEGLLDGLLKKGTAS